MCNVTSSVGSMPLWVGHQLREINSSCFVNATDCICEEQNGTRGNSFWMLSGQEQVFDETGAELVQTSIALVLCNATPNLETKTFTCQLSEVSQNVTVSIVRRKEKDSSTSSTTEQPFKTASLTASPSTVTKDPTVSILFLSIFIPFLCLIITVIMVAMVITCRIVHQRQKMVLLTPTVTNNTFPLVHVDKMEFTRERLVFIEKLGKPQLMIISTVFNM